MSFADFMRAMPDLPQGEDVAELIDLIEHEPKRGGFLGVQAPRNTIGRWSESANLCTRSVAERLRGEAIQP
jgi:hypothetical protein